MAVFRNYPDLPDNRVAITDEQVIEISDESTATANAVAAVSDGALDSITLVGTSALVAHEQVITLEGDEYEFAITDGVITGITVTPA